MAPATTDIYTLSLHDALPIWGAGDPAGRGREGKTAAPGGSVARARGGAARGRYAGDGSDSACAQRDQDRKSTRLNSSHGYISYAVFCLKKKNRAGGRREHSGM